MFGWLICIWVFIFLGGLAKSGVNMWMYFEVMVKHQEAGPKNPNPRIDDPIVVMSNVFSFLDFLCVYFVVLLTLVIPYQWLLYSDVGSINFCQLYHKDKKINHLTCKLV